MLDQLGALADQTMGAGTFKGMDAPIKLEQVAVKQWEGDQVMHERFYFNA